MASKNVRLKPLWMRKIVTEPEKRFDSPIEAGDQVYIHTIMGREYWGKANIRPMPNM